jgi:hypothetical protein
MPLLIFLVCAVVIYSVMVSLYRYLNLEEPRRDSNHFLMVLISAMLAGLIIAFSYGPA